MGGPHQFYLTGWKKNPHSSFQFFVQALGMELIAPRCLEKPVVALVHEAHQRQLAFGGCLFCQRRQYGDHDIIDTTQEDDYLVLVVVALYVLFYWLDGTDGLVQLFHVHDGIPLLRFGKKRVTTENDGVTVIENGYLHRRSLQRGDELIRGEIDNVNAEKVFTHRRLEPPPT